MEKRTGINKTSTMNTRQLLEPVIFEKGKRGREMASKSVTNIRNKGSTESAEENEPEMYHEGYIEGKKYLVPDKNLKAMADMINFKMRKHEEPKMLQLENPNKDQLEWYGNRRDSIMAKLDDMGLSEEEKQEEEEKAEEEQEEEQEEEEVEEEGKQEEEQEEESVEEGQGEVEEEAEEEEDVEEEGEEESVKEGLEEEEESVKEDIEEEEESVKEEIEEEELPAKKEAEEIKPEEDKDTIFPGKYYDPNVQRFLISGHFRTNRKPIYIIQQYAGPPVFSVKDPQFYSHKSEKDADIIIAGQFYKETILEEDEDNHPKRLKTKPYKVFVDGTSRVYEDKFSDTFVGEDVDVTLTGSFIKHTLTTMYTPLLAISLKKGTATARKDGGSETATAVYVSNPVVHNIFERQLKLRSGDDRENLPKRPKTKLRLRQRKKAGYSPDGYSTDKLESPVFVSRREKFDERYSDNTGERVGDSPRPDARSCRRDKRKGSLKRTDLEQEGDPINVEIKIDIQSDKKKSAAKQILHRFFQTD